MTAPGSSAYTKKIEYNYDDDGNRSSVVVTPYGGSSTTTSYTTNNLNEYTQVGGTNRSHDANGNVTDDGTYTFEYNYNNLIVKVTRKSDSTVVGGYRYDAEGRRVEKSAGGDIERYIRSRFRENAGGRYSMSHVVSVFDGSNVWQQNFVWADTPDSIEMLEQADVLDHDSDGNTTEVTRSFYHRNALGSVMEITDANEASVASYRYDPYGNMTITRGGVTQTTDPLGQHWGFTGRFQDEESGLWYYRARYYDSERGRFMQRDPLGYAGEANLFEYVASNATNSVDPSGLEPANAEQIAEWESDHGDEADHWMDKKGGDRYWWLCWLASFHAEQQSATTDIVKKWKPVFELAEIYKWINKVKSTKPANIGVLAGALGTMVSDIKLRFAQAKAATAERAVECSAENAEHQAGRSGTIGRGREGVSWPGFFTRQDGGDGGPRPHRRIDDLGDLGRPHRIAKVRGSGQFQVRSHLGARPNDNLVAVGGGTLA